MKTISNMFTKVVADHLISNLTKRLEEIGFNMSEWEIDISDPINEGHPYKFGEDVYEEISDVYIVNKYNPKEKFSLWIDYAWVEGMRNPLLFLESISTENPNLFEKYYIKRPRNPDHIISKNLTEEQRIKLYKEEYFKKGKHLSLWRSK